MADTAKLQTNPDEEIIVVGLDIGTTKVVAVVGQRDETTGKINILGYGKTESTGVVRGAVINIERTAEAVKRAVEQATATSNVEIKEVYVGIAGQHIETEIRDYTYVRENGEAVFSRKEIEDLKLMVSRGSVSPGRKILHVIPRTFSVDGEGEFSEDSIVGMVGTDIHVKFNVITADEVAMRNIQRSVEMAGLELNGFILEPLVSAEAVLDESDKEAGVVLVDIGGGTTDVAMFLNGILVHTAVIPLAGNAITNDIKVTCTILPKQAEALKVKFGSALPEKSSDEQFVSIPIVRGSTSKEISLKLLSTIIRSRVDEIFTSVACEIANCGYNFERFLGGVVLTGGGSKLKHVGVVCEFHTQLETRLGSPKEHITADSPAELADPIFATAIGLVLYGVRSEEEAFLMAEKENKTAPIPETETEMPEQSESALQSQPTPRQKKVWGGFIKAREWIVGMLDDENIDR